MITELEKRFMEYLKRGDQIVTTDALDMKQVCKHLDREGIEYRTEKNTIYITKGVPDRKE
jgi:hypothetical protein